MGNLACTYWARLATGVQRGGGDQEQAGPTEPDTGAQLVPSEFRGRQPRPLPWHTARGRFLPQSSARAGHQWYIWTGQGTKVAGLAVEARASVGASPGPPALDPLPLPPPHGEVLALRIPDAHASVSHRSSLTLREFPLCS